MRRKDIDMEKELKEEALHKLTTKERELRKHIEDLIASHAKSTKVQQLNGRQLNGEAKKGKKRKVPS